MSARCAPRKKRQIVVAHQPPPLCCGQSFLQTESNQMRHPEGPLEEHQHLFQAEMDQAGSSEPTLRESPPHPPLGSWGLLLPWPGLTSPLIPGSAGLQLLPLFPPVPSSQSAGPCSGHGPSLLPGSATGLPGSLFSCLLDSSAVGSCVL